MWGLFHPFLLRIALLKWLANRGHSVTVDDRLTCTLRLSEVKKNFANKYPLKSVLKQFHLSVVLPSITYGLVTWASCNNSELFRSIEELHGRAAKLIYNFLKYCIMWQFFLYCSLLYCGVQNLNVSFLNSLWNTFVLWISVKCISTAYLFLRH